MPAWTDRVVLITGASDGIGAELAVALARQGARLMLAARREELLQQVAQRCREAGREGRGVAAEVDLQVADVADPAQCDALVERTVARFGELDALVANAGVSAHGWFEQVSDFGYYEQVMKVNCFGVMWCVRAALPHLKRRRGLVVGVSSLAGLVGVPGRTAYSASKFALSGFLESLRAELRHGGSGVDVLTVYPGVVATATRVRGFGPDGRALGESRLREDGAMSAATCAAQMLDAMTARRRELVMTPQGKAGRWLKLLVPGLVDRMAMKALKQPGR